MIRLLLVLSAFMTAPLFVLADDTDSNNSAVGGTKNRRVEIILYE